MNLYRWKSEYLENYSKGDIIVMAESVESAREIARKGFEVDVREYKVWDFYDPNELTDDLLEYYQEYKETFEKDISKEPEIVESCVLFISGSE